MSHYQTYIVITRLPTNLKKFVNFSKFRERLHHLDDTKTLLLIFFSFAQQFSIVTLASCIRSEYSLVVMSGSGNYESKVKYFL